jgi:hypothetical protein
MPLDGQCKSGHLHIENTTQARIALVTAIELYQSMEMMFWLPEAEAALAQVEGR